MTTLFLENETDSLDLNGVAATGWGFQALFGLTGLGLPPVSVQWVNGGGDGSIYRSTRVLERDIDLPLDIVAQSRHDLEALLSRLVRMLAGEATLRLVDGGGSEWSLRVVRVGGGEYDEIGSLDLQTVITLRAGTPYWTSTSSSSQQIGGSAAPAAFAPNLMSMPLASSQSIGTITIENTGDAVAYPVWEVYGPGNNFKAVSPSGETLWWTGTLIAGEKLTIDTLKGTVVDGTGANRYANLAASPRFWPVQPGTTTCTAQLLDTTSASRIVCSWRARKWMVI